MGREAIQPPGWSQPRIPTGICRRGRTSADAIPSPQSYTKRPPANLCVENRTVSASRSWRLKLAERDGLVCQHCGEAGSVDGSDPTLTLDHIDLGGGNSMENLQLLCRSCNSSKGAGDNDPPPVRWASSTLQVGFTIVPNCVLLNPSLSANATRLFSVLAHFAGKSANCWPGQERLAATLGVSERTIRDARKELEGEGLVRTQRRGMGRTNIYVLQLPKAAGDVSFSADQDRKQAAAPDRKQAAAELEQENKNQKPSAPRRRNVVWDILVEFFGEPVTKSEIADFGKTVSEVGVVLREALDDAGYDATALVDPDPVFRLPVETAARREVGRRVEAMGEPQYRTHRRLRNQWSELGRRAGTPADEVGAAIRGQADKWWGVCPCGHDVNGEMVFNMMCPDCGGTGKDGWAS